MQRLQWVEHLIHAEVMAAFEASRASHARAQTFLDLDPTPASARV